MEELIEKGFRFEEVTAVDLEMFIYVEKESHGKYIVEHSDFFGEWNESILKSAFYEKFETTCYQKILLNNEIVGFWGYDRKDYIIDNVFIKIISKAQNRGVGTTLLTNLISLSKEYNIPVKVVVIKTNSAQNLYKRMGFQLFKEEDVFYYFMYNHENS